MKKIKTEDLRKAFSSKKRKEKKQQKQQMKQMKQMKFLTKKNFNKDIKVESLYYKGKETGQVTDNAVVFEAGNLELRISLFFETEVPEKFNVADWFYKKSFEEKFLIGELLLKLIDKKVYKDYREEIHCEFCNVVDGEDKNIIGYCIEIFNHTDFEEEDEYILNEIVNSQQIDNISTYFHED
ncbi:hypothetical protein [Flavobacterium sp. FlaQc-28]|uniref:hypothetical protein n=1 Tax=Flavobacterium sp. FlaQc-28 TaxID=3374178 RepID=UPI00375831F7